MASEESSTIPISSLATKDEFEGLEMIEFDPNTLQDLLYEPGEEVESGRAAMQPMEAVGLTPGLTPDSYICIDDFNENVQNFDWLYMVEETHAPCIELGAWCGEPYMEEINGFLEMGDYSVSHNAIMSNEIGYIGLWQENQD